MLPWKHPNRRPAARVAGWRPRCWEQAQLEGKVKQDEAECCEAKGNRVEAGGFEDDAIEERARGTDLVREAMPGAVEIHHVVGVKIVSQARVSKREEVQRGS